MPSIVVPDRPATSRVATAHARASAPSMSTLQAPHAASPQPYFVPVSPTASRSQQRQIRRGADVMDDAVHGHPIR
jgi:hypothetical protein